MIKNKSEAGHFYRSTDTKKKGGRAASQQFCPNEKIAFFSVGFIFYSMYE